MLLTTQGIPRWVVAGTRAITATEVDDLGFTPRPPAQCQYELEREARVARHNAFLDALLAKDALVMARKAEVARKVEAEAARKAEAEVARKVSGVQIYIDQVCTLLSRSFGNGPCVRMQHPTTHVSLVCSV